MSEQRAGVVPEFTVGDRLRKAREVAGIEQGAFALQLGVSRGTVSNYERDSTKHYKPIVLRAWAMATGVPVEWLESGAGSSTPQPPAGSRSDELAALTQRKRARTRPAKGGAPTAGYFLAA